MYQQFERISRCMWVIALFILLGLLSTCIDPSQASASDYHYQQNDECQIYVIVGQVPLEDHMTFQIEVFGTEIDHSEYLTHHSKEVAIVINQYMTEFACNVTWSRAEG